MLVITSLRLKKGWSKAELARRSRMHISDMTRIEQGMLKPYPVQLTRLAGALGFAGPADKLLEGANSDKARATEGGPNAKR